MTNRPKIQGTKMESAVRNWLKDRGWIYADRIAPRGARDEGDVIFGESIPVVIQSKNTPKWTPSGYVNDVEEQIQNAAAEFGFAVVKKRGTTDVGKYYALCSMERMTWLIEQVWDKPVPVTERKEPGRKIIRRVT